MEREYLNKTFGVEIEFAGLDLVRVAKAIRGLKLRHGVIRNRGWVKSSGKTWNVKPDNSVSEYADNSVYGGEITTPILTPNAVSFNEMANVFNILNSLGARFHEDCGLHVHLDITGIDKFKLLLSLLYNEQEFYERCSQSRRTTEYAIPYKRLTKKQLVKPLQRKLGEILLESRFEWLFEEDHYHAYAFYKRGNLKMLEIRMGQASKDIENMMAHIKCILKAVKLAKNIDIVEFLSDNKKA